MPHFAEAFEVVAARENPHHAACASVAARLQIQSRIPHYHDLIYTGNPRLLHGTEDQERCGPSLQHLVAADARVDDLRPPPDGLQKVIGHAPVEAGR